MKISLKLLNEQYNEVADSNMNEDEREGLLNFLADLEWELKHDNEVTIRRN